MGQIPSKVVLALCWSSEKTNDPIPRKYPDRWKDGKKDGMMDRPYFIGPFWLPPGVQEVQIQ